MLTSFLCITILSPPLLACFGPWCHFLCRPLAQGKSQECWQDFIQFCVHLRQPCIDVAQHCRIVECIGDLCLGHFQGCPLTELAIGNLHQSNESQVFCCTFQSRSAPCQHSNKREMFNTTAHLFGLVLKQRVRSFTGSPSQFWRGVSANGT